MKAFLALLAMVAVGCYRPLPLPTVTLSTAPPTPSCCPTCPAPEPEPDDPPATLPPCGQGQSAWDVYLAGNGYDLAPGQCITRIWCPQDEAASTRCRS
jgi:hypothetical protein